MNEAAEVEVVMSTLFVLPASSACSFGINAPGE
jgi:hypothetical protein